jgi:hypothetical protein
MQRCALASVHKPTLHQDAITRVLQALGKKMRLDRLSKVCCIAISALIAALMSDGTSKAFLLLTFLMKNKEVRSLDCVRHGSARTDQSCAGANRHAGAHMFWSESNR